MLEAHIAMEAPRVWRENIVRGHKARVTIRSWMAHAECCKVFVEIHVDPGTEKALVEEMDAIPSITTEDLVVTNPGILKGTLSTHECLGCCSANSSRGFLLEANFHDDGQLVQVVVAPDREAVKEMVSHMERHGHQVTLMKLTTLEREELLTERQENILLTALEKGFFDDPKGTSLRDLAQSFGVSISTASETLRKATYKVMDAYFKAIS